jgi:predicted nucleotidyltransferase
MDTTHLARRLGGFFTGLADDGVLLAYLFGSLAADRGHRESDVDIAVLLDPNRYREPRARFEAQLRLIGELMRALATDAVDLVVLNDAPPLFARRIAYEGICVHRRDSDAERDFLRDVQLHAADIEPFLRRFRARKLEALAR